MCQRSLVPKALECWAHTRPLEEALKAPPPLAQIKPRKMSRNRMWWWHLGF